MNNLHPIFNRALRGFRPSSDDEITCPDCNGSGEGQHESSTCRTCRGSGAVVSAAAAQAAEDAEGERKMEERREREDAA